MSMFDMSMRQALSVWSELDDALHGKNGFGGDVAEVYIYRVMAYRPGGAGSIESQLASPILGPDIRKEYERANVALHDLLLHFSQERDVRIEVDGRDLGPWLKREFNTHRIHVKVTPHGIHEKQSQ